MNRNLQSCRVQNMGFGLNTISDDGLNDIHLATLEVLSKTGVYVGDDEALEIYHAGGANVDKNKKIVKIPPHVVEDAVRSTPSKFVACGRIPEQDVILEANRVCFTNFGEGISITDPYTGELRPTYKSDVANAALLVDKLEHIDVYERAMLSSDVPHEVSALHNAEASLINTTKHNFLGPLDQFQARKIVEMLTVICGSKEKLIERPLLTFLTCPVSPLKLVPECCQIIMEAAKSGIGVNVLSMAMAGGSAPIHLAGTLVIHNAEVLAGLTLAQLTNKGTPVVYGSSTTAMDMKLAAASVGSPECAKISAAVARLAQFYALPSFVAGG
ncbi:MAG: trimethylamine methyltransferase family protein [Desulfobacterales bacterium]|nr:trimethylamine methyltransferase family protein [Desulfobacterales bacterium]